MQARKLASRREFLRLSALAATSAAIAAACAPAPPPTPTPAPKPAPAPAAPAPAAPPTATTAPAPKPAEAPKPTEAPKPAPAAPTATPAAAAKPAAKGPVELRVHDWLQDPDDKIYGPYWKAFEEKNPGIKIKREWFPRGDMHTKQLALAATNQIGDVVRHNVAPMTAELRAKNVIQALDPYIKADKPWLENDQPQFWPGNIATYTIQGQQWGYPIVGHPGCIHNYYNIDYLKSVNAPQPPVDLEKKTFDASKWKLDDALTLFKAAVKTGADGRISTYGVQPCLGGEGAVAVLRSFGGNYYNNEGTKCLINTPESIAALEWLADLWGKHKVAIPLETAPNWTETFPSGRTAVVVLTAVAGTVKSLVKDKFQWAVVPPPIGPSGKFETQVSSDGLGMAKITKYPEEAWAYIKSYVSKDFGVLRHLGGLGSPGSRYDVWTDPRFKQEQPLLSSIIYDNLINPAKAPPLRPWSYPINGRYNETDTAMNNILQEVWLGKKKPKEAAEEAFKTVQAIMDKPPT